ncbi:hypothetical protein Taro_010230, partial [Colocasia esculenta]|nr:hypothetical protein [Colocasia esculenta]
LQELFSVLSPESCSFLGWEFFEIVLHRLPEVGGLMEGSDLLRLEDYTVGPLGNVIYIPNFISSAEEAQLLRNVGSGSGTWCEILTIYEAPISKWKSLKNRRLQNWGGVVYEKGLLPQDCDAYFSIQPHQDGPAYFPVVAILSLGSPIVIDFTPHPRLRQGTKNMQEESAANGNPMLESSVWTNESSCEQVEDHHELSLLLMPCSLLIFKDQAYADYLHGIQDSDVQNLAKIVNTSEALKLPDEATSGKSFELGNSEQHQILCRTATRVSLTCRLVLKVHKNLFRF